MYADADYESADELIRDIHRKPVKAVIFDDPEKAVCMCAECMKERREIEKGQDT